MSKKLETQYKVWGYDYEVFEKINWWCVTFIDYFDRDNEVVIINDVNALSDFYKKNKDAIFTGYNSRNYDRCIFGGLLNGYEAGELNHALIVDKQKPFQIVKGFNKIQLYDYDAIIKDKSLKVCEAFMGDDIRETTVDFNLDRPMTEEEVEEVLFYNKHDVKELLRVIDQTIDDFQGQLDIIDLYKLELKYISKTKVQLAGVVLNVVDSHTTDDEFDIRLPDTINISDKYKFIPEWYMNPKNWRYKEHLKSEDTQHPNQLLCTVAGIPHVFGYGGCHGCDDKESIFEGIILHCDVALGVKHWGN